MRIESSNRGFSLIELMFVLGFILILTAIATPALIQSRIAANEANAAGTVRVIIRSEVAYALAFNSGYSPDLYSLGPVSQASAPSPSRADLVDITLSGSAPGTVSFIKKGYIFTYSPTGTFPAVGAYQLTGVPVSPRSTGNRFFYADQSLVIRTSRTGPAGPNDPPIPN